MAEVRHTPFTDSSPSHIFLECLLSLRAPRPNPPLPFSFCLCNFSLLVTLCCTVTYSRAAYCFLSSPFFFYYRLSRFFRVFALSLRQV